MEVHANLIGRHQTSSLENSIGVFTRGERNARRRALRKTFKLIRDKAIENISINNEETGVPRTGALEASIGFNVDNGHMWAGGPGITYAAIHDIGENTDGTTTIWANPRGKSMVFYNNRTGEWNSRKEVRMPGYAYFTRAWNFGVEVFPDIYLSELDKEL